MLAVQEKSGVLQGTGVWKFPTGVVDEVCVCVPGSFVFDCHSNGVWFKSNQYIKHSLVKGEDICVAAVREVKEETGVSIYIEFTLPYI